MKFEDKVEVISMMKTFYSSEAVFTNGSDEIFEADFNTCIDNIFSVLSLFFSSYFIYIPPRTKSD